MRLLLSFFPLMILHVSTVENINLFSLTLKSLQSLWLFSLNQSKPTTQVSATLFPMPFPWLSVGWNFFLYRPLSRLTEKLDIFVRKSFGIFRSLPFRFRFCLLNVRGAKRKCLYSWFPLNSWQRFGLLLSDKRIQKVETRKFHLHIVHGQGLGLTISQHFFEQARRGKQGTHWNL